MKQLRVLMGLLTGCVLLANMAFGQLITGTISGAVIDPSGASVPGAAISIRNVETGLSRSTSSNAQGRYEASSLPIGRYEVSAGLAGFQTTIRTGIELTVGRHAVVDLSLQVGEVAQSITVTGEAAFVETTTATVSNLVDENRVADLPLNNRDLTQLAYLQPGVCGFPNLESPRRRAAWARKSPWAARGERKMCICWMG